MQRKQGNCEEYISSVYVDIDIRDALEHKDHKSLLKYILKVAKVVRIASGIVTVGSAIADASDELDRVGADWGDAVYAIRDPLGTSEFVRDNPDALRDAFDSAAAITINIGTLGILDPTGEQVREYYSRLNLWADPYFEKTASWLRDTLF